MTGEPQISFLFNFKTTQPNLLLFNFGPRLNPTSFPGQHSINIEVKFVHPTVHCLTCVYILSLVLLEAPKVLTLITITSFVQGAINGDG